MNLLSTAEFWLTVSFVLFLILFSKKIYKAISGFLEDKINEIDSTIEESDASHTEAANLFNEKRQELNKVQTENSNFLTKNQKNYELALQKSMQELDEKIEFNKNQKNTLLKQYKKNFEKKIPQATIKSAFSVAKKASLEGISREEHLRIIKNSTQKLTQIVKQRREQN